MKRLRRRIKILVLYGTNATGEGNGYDADVKTPPESRRRNQGTRAHPRGGLSSVQEERLRDDQHSGDRDTRARFKARALRASWQQTGNADRLHQRAREATGRTR